ncbi:unnamed protein product, partial [Ectocarpus sp. 13 AM-2016]
GGLDWAAELLLLGFWSLALAPVPPLPPPSVLVRWAWPQRSRVLLLLLLLLLVRLAWRLSLSRSRPHGDVASSAVVPGSHPLLAVAAAAAAAWRPAVGAPPRARPRAPVSPRSTESGRHRWATLEPFVC